MTHYYLLLCLNIRYYAVLLLINSYYPIWLDVIIHYS